MKLVTTTGVLADKFGMDKAIDMIADAGFDGLDFSAFDMVKDDSIYNGENYKEIAKAMREKAESRNLEFLQAHAPFPSAKGEPVFDKMAKERIIRSMEISSILGVEIIVVHPMQHLIYVSNVEKLYEMNMEFYRSLIPYCEKFGIKIATENLFQGDNRRNVKVDSVCASPQEFSRYIDDLNSEWITGCLDLGHVGLCGRLPQDVIRYMGAGRIQALHVHDNNYKDDCHTLPCTMDMDWEGICKALKEIGYKGHFTYEADNFLLKYTDEFLPTALKFMNDTGRYLINKIER